MSRITEAARAAIPMLLSFSLLGCQAATPNAGLEPREIATPAGPGSGEPNLAVHDGTTYLSWLEPAGEGRHALRFATMRGSEWSAPRTIATGENFFVNWADFPSVVALPDGRLAAHWLVRSGPGTYAYDVHIAQSSDGGETWSPSVLPHRDGTQTEHGFVSLFPWHDGRLGALWLDGRNFAEADGEAGHHGGAEMTLRHTLLDADNTPGPEVLLDDRICDCCQTSVALTSRGPLAVYRDRSPDEIRDISVIRFVDGRWTAPRPVHRDGWQIHGCPVNGPAAAAAGEQVAVAWFTAADESPRVQVTFSSDAGTSFGSPLHVDDGDPLGRVHVVMLDHGDALVSWLERVGDGAEIRVRQVSSAGERGPSRVVSASTAACASGFPRMARSGDDLVFAWTEPGEPSQVRTAVARLP
jgi:hypothetical protein